MIYHPFGGDFYNCPAFHDSEKINVKGTRAYYKNMGGDKIIIIYHGNAGSACDRAHLKNIFENYGYSHLFVEYAGFGGDSRKPTRELLFNDAENIVSFLGTKDYRKTLLFAESLGSGIASYHASLMPVDGIFLISPFDSLINVAKAKFPFYPIFLLEKISDENYDNVEMLSDYKGLVKIIHGNKDIIIPYSHGKRLFESINSLQKYFIIIENAGHNNIYSFKRTAEEISNFLNYWNEK